MKRKVLAAVSFAAFAGAVSFGADTMARRVSKNLTIDGAFKDWGDAPRLEYRKVNTNDLKPDFGGIAWNDGKLFLGFRVYDTKVVNTNSFDLLSNGDSCELRFCASDDRRDKQFRLVVTPTSSDGKPAMTFSEIVGRNGKTMVSAHEGEDSKGIEWAVRIEKKYWSVEAAIPMSLVGMKPAVGTKVPFRLIGWDRDSATKDEWGTGWKRRVETASTKIPPSEWPTVTLCDEKAIGVTHPANAIEIVRHSPCNMFCPDEDVKFVLVTKAFPEGAEGSLACTVRDAYGKTCLSSVKPFVASKNGTEISFGRLARGYYELSLETEVKDAKTGRPFAGEAKATLGVMEQPKYDLAAFMREGRRFGLKWWGGVSNYEECKKLIDDLGINWSRAIFREAVMITTNTDINAIVKVERFPKELYDEDKYGPMAEWEKKFGRGGWSLKTLPKEKEYRAYLREQIASIPAGRNVFEIWNEPWDKLNPQDLSTLCGWIAEELRKVRPGAVLGPNLKGDMSKYGYDAKVIEAGGMKGMDMVCLHPYSTSEDRQWLRDYRKWISEKCGKPIDIYITEYGAHSCPQGPSRRSEREQSAMTVRQSLCLYAEDCKALVPHWIGQSERNPVYHEDWFGYVRKNLQPKPVLLALTNCARLIDASEYRGDLWFGPGLAAMLFLKDGHTVLALYANGEARDFTLKLPASKLTLVDTYGTESEVVAKDGAFTVKVGSEPVYLTGLPADLKGDKAIRADRFPPPPKPPRNVRKVGRMAKVPTFDGNLDDWKGTYEVAIQNEKVNGDDASGFGYLAWDENYLYVAVDMRDNELLNNKPRSTLYRNDSVELFVSTEPREENPGYGPNDFQFIIAPTSGEGKPICGWLSDRAAGVLEDVKGAKFAIGTHAKGWRLECAIPWAALGGFKPAVGRRIAVEPHVNDADTSHERWKLDPLDGNVRPENPTVWSIMEMK